MEPSLIRGVEHAAFMRAVHSAFHQVRHRDDTALDESLYEPERSLVLVDESEIVATTLVYTPASSACPAPSSPPPASPTSACSRATAGVGWPGA